VLEGVLALQISGIRQKRCKARTPGLPRRTLISTSLPLKKLDFFKGTHNQTINYKPLSTTDYFKKHRLVERSLATLSEEKSADDFDRSRREPIRNDPFNLAMAST
jgi:hypothetical protein